MLQVISNYAGLFSIILTIAAAVMLAKNTGKNNAEKDAAEAQSKTINAMQARLDVQSSSIEEMRKENARLEQLVGTICSALKTRGMLITIQGELINIEDLKSGKMTVTRINTESRDKA